MITDNSDDEIGVEIEVEVEDGVPADSTESMRSSALPERLTELLERVSLLTNRLTKSTNIGKNLGILVSSLLEHFEKTLKEAQVALKAREKDVKKAEIAEKSVQKSIKEYEEALQELLSFKAEIDSGAASDLFEKEQTDLAALATYKAALIVHKINIANSNECYKQTLQVIKENIQQITTCCNDIASRLAGENLQNNIHAIWSKYSPRPLPTNKLISLNILDLPHSIEETMKTSPEELCQIITAYFGGLGNFPPYISSDNKVKLTLITPNENNPKQPFSFERDAYFLQNLVLIKQHGGVAYYAVTGLTQKVEDTSDYNGSHGPVKLQRLLPYIIKVDLGHSHTSILKMRSDINFSIKMKAESSVGAEEEVAKKFSVPEHNLQLGTSILEDNEEVTIEDMISCHSTMEEKDGCEPKLSVLALWEEGHSLEFLLSKLRDSQNSSQVTFPWMLAFLQKLAEHYNAFAAKLTQYCIDTPNDIKPANLLLGSNGFKSIDFSCEMGGTQPYNPLPDRRGEYMNNGVLCNHYAMAITLLQVFTGNTIDQLIRYLNEDKDNVSIETLCEKMINESVFQFTKQQKYAMKDIFITLLNQPENILVNTDNEDNFVNKIKTVEGYTSDVMPLVFSDQAPSPVKEACDPSSVNALSTNELGTRVLNPSIVYAPTEPSAHFTAQKALASNRALVNDQIENQQLALELGGVACLAMAGAMGAGLYAAFAPVLVPATGALLVTITTVFAGLALLLAVKSLAVTGLTLAMGFFGEKSSESPAPEAEGNQRLANRYTTV